MSNPHLSSPIPASQAVLWAVLVTCLGFRVLLALGTDLYFDETYYWTWAQRLDTSYLDHPPLIAWMIRVFSVRGTSLLVGFLTVLAVYLFARRIQNSHEAGLRAAALWSTLPSGLIAGVIATPDTPLLLFWTLAAWAVWEEKWHWAAVAFGFALLSKYTAVLLGLAVVLTFLGKRKWPKGAFWAGVGASVLFAPVVFWNAQHDWAGFRFQFAHGTSAHTGGLHAFLEFLGGQALMAGPILFIWLWSLARSAHAPLLRWATWVPILFFGLASLRTRGEANWPVVAYVTAVVAFAQRKSLWTYLSLALGGLLVVGGSLYLLTGFPGPANSVVLKRLHGWTVLSHLRDIPASALFAGDYHLASEGAYYSRLPAGVVRSDRPTQFDFWGAPPLDKGDTALWISADEAPPEELSRTFDSVEGPLEFPSDFRGQRIHTFRVWLLIGYQEPSIQREE